MEYFNVQKLGDLIREYIQMHKGPDYLDELKVINSWKTVVGPFIASHTIDLAIRNKMLFVRVDSDALRMELSFSKSVLKDNLNAQAGREVITDIVLQ
ncbi:MAG: DUF721 domain-containing protein [Bacteroidales bacterium]|nr:DUF721 domain-containing protein [Bacteroidales bacterium]